MRERRGYHGPLFVVIFAHWAPSAANDVFAILVHNIEPPIHVIKLFAVHAPALGFHITITLRTFLNVQHWKWTGAAVGVAVGVGVVVGVAVGVGVVLHSNHFR